VLRSRGSIFHPTREGRAETAVGEPYSSGWEKPHATDAMPYARQAIRIQELPMQA
jgi:hypothetical protein